MGPPPSGVVFDLFGTLVPQFPRVAHNAVLDECSRIAGLDPAACRRAWRELYIARVKGDVAGIAGHLAHVADGQGVALPPERLDAARVKYHEFVQHMLVPTDDALALLSLLRASGASIGLLSNAHDDVAHAFRDCELAPHFDAVVFSCRIGYAKPDSRAFGAVADALGAADPHSLVFVGDGSDDELSGAERHGMRAVLLRTDPRDAYDRERPDLAGWAGAAVDILTDLPAVLGWPCAANP